MSKGLNDHQHDGTPVPVAPLVVVVLAALFGSTAAVAGYGGILLTREGSGLLAILLGVLLLVFATMAACVAIGVPVQQYRLRRGLRQLGR
jgi:hypothetical protein